MGLIVGGEKAWRKYKKGDIAACYHWVNNEPAMILFPLNRAPSPMLIPFVIPLSVAHQYVDSSGQPNLVNAMGAAIEAAGCMGMAPEMSTVHRIIDIIVDGIPDLVSMPPEPDWAEDLSKPLDGELSILRDGEKVVEVAV